MEGKIWLNNSLVDRLAMLQQAEIDHPGINQVAIEKDWWVTMTLKALFQTDAIMQHRRVYYALKYVDYNVKSDSICFMIPKSEIDAWKADYADMRKFFIYGKSLEFDMLMRRMEELQNRIRTLKC